MCRDFISWLDKGYSLCYAVFVGKTSLRMEFLWLKISSPAPCVESVPLHAHAVATKRIIAWSVTWTGRGLKTLLSRACAPVCGSRVCARVRVCAVAYMARESRTSYPRPREISGVLACGLFIFCI